MDTNTQTLSFDQASLEQAIINGAIKRLCESRPFRDECTAAIASKACEDLSLRSDFRTAAKEKSGEHLDRFEKQLEDERECQVNRAKRELGKKYDQEIRTYSKTKLSEQEIKNIACSAVREQIHRAFGRRAHKLARSVLDGGQDRIKLLLSEELGGE